MTLKKISFFSINIVLAAIFLLSAWFKLFPIEPFEYKIVGTTFFGWVSSVFVARIVISLELFLALMLLLSVNLKTTLKLSLFILAIFTIHLTVDLILNGNQSDCGCMGSLMSFTPIQGIIKNLIMIAGVSVLLINYEQLFKFKFKLEYFSFYILLISGIAVFASNPVELTYSEKYLNKPFEGFKLDLDTLYNTVYGEKIEQPSMDVRDKKLILGFLSASCPHCKIAAQKISVIKRRNPNLPFYFFINGDQKDIEKFLTVTETENIPHSRLNGHLFVQLAGLHLPIIYYYSKGFIDKQVDYYTLEQYHIEKWYKN
ncbi:MAG: hypothetical protein R2852_00690 [Bacteroidia bacterium]